MAVNTIPVAAFEYRANNAQALSSTAELRGAVTDVNNLKLGGLDSQFQKLGATIGRFVPVLTAAGVASFALSAVRAADAMGDAAERAGLSVETFSRLQFVAQQSDIEFTELTSSIRKYQDGLGNAIRGTGSMVGALGDLNLNARELSKLPLEEQLARIADRFRDTVPKVEQTRVATDLFGKSGQALIPLLLKGSAGIRELTEEADRLGITLDTRAVQAIDRGTKALDKWTTAAKNAAASGIGNFLADIFGTGDELTDLEEKYGKIEARLQGLQRYAANFPGNAAAGRTNERIASLTAQLAALEPRLQVLRDLNALERGEDISSGPDRRRIDPVHEIQITARKIGNGDDEYDKILADIAKRRADEQEKLNDMFLAQQQDVRDMALSAEEEAQKEISKVVIGELNTRMDAIRSAKQDEFNAELQLQEDILRIRQQGMLAAQTLLTAYGGRFAGIARAILVVEKTMALKSIFMDTQAAMMKVIKQWGAPWGYVAAGAVAVYGAARAAAVASTVAGGDSAPSMGSPHNPTYTAPGSDDLNVDANADPAGQRVVQLVINGNFYGNQEMIDYMLDNLADRINNFDSVVISRNSRQAQELLEPQ